MNSYHKKVRCLKCGGCEELERVVLMSYEKGNRERYFSMKMCERDKMELLEMTDKWLESREKAIEFLQKKLKENGK